MLTKLQSKVIFILGLLFIVVMGCTEPKLTTGSQKDAKVVEDIFRQHDITYINEKYGFSLVFPQTWQGNYNVDYHVNTVGIHHKATWLKNGEGTLFTVWVFQTQKRAEEYKEIADMIGIWKVYEDDKQIFGISTPTDVQYIIDDRQLRDQYAQLEKDASKIAKSFKKIN